ncbi:DNA lesion error-prone repair protein ImuA, partial [Pseudomonas aeruginosa]|nr:DNA lesion error-prone repair protein ImuA [Pseudomonas aeruginosa]
MALSALLDARRIWKGQSAIPAGASQPTGHVHLDALLPGGGWPEHALSEILHARDGVGELQLLMPTLARLTQAQRRVV